MFLKTVSAFIYQKALMLHFTQFFYYKITYVNAHTRTQIQKLDFVLKTSFKRPISKISGIQK